MYHYVPAYFCKGAPDRLNTLSFVGWPLNHSKDLLTLPPPPEAIRGGQVDFIASTPVDERHNRVTVFYATKRLPIDDGTWYSKKHDDQLRVGSAELQIGRDGLPWSVLHIESTKAAEPRMEFDISLTEVNQSGELGPKEVIMESKNRRKQK
jgi:hypothetical protein